MIIAYFTVSLLILVFFVFGIYATVFMLKTPKLELEKKHWTIKMFWWFGVYFLGLVLGASVLGLALSFTFLLLKTIGG